MAQAKESDYGEDVIDSKEVLRHLRYVLALSRRNSKQPPAYFLASPHPPQLSTQYLPILFGERMCRHQPRPGKMNDIPDHSKGDVSRLRRNAAASRAGRAAGRHYPEMS